MITAINRKRDAERAALQKLCDRESTIICSILWALVAASFIASVVSGIN